MLAPGRRLGRYVVEAHAGSGGMAEVYRVRHDLLDRPFALKVLRVASPDLEARLLAEGRAQSRLRHPNVVSVVDIVEEDGVLGLVLDWVDGPTLAEVLADGPLPVAQAVPIFLGILAGIHEAHVQGFVHRDVKPANVLLERSGDTWWPRVTDFGIARVLRDDDPGRGLTGPGMLLGTLRSMAPEQVSDPSRVDHRADIFSLGCLLYEAVCGVSPFDHGTNAAETLNAMARGRYVPARQRVPDLLPAVDRTIDACLRPDPSRRPPTVRAVRDLVRGEDRHAGRWPRRVVLARLAWLGGGLGVIGGGVTWWRSGDHLLRPEDAPAWVGEPADARQAADPTGGDGSGPVPAAMHETGAGGATPGATVSLPAPAASERGSRPPASTPVESVSEEAAPNAPLPDEAAPIEAAPVGGAPSDAARAGLALADGLPPASPSAGTFEIVGDQYDLCLQGAGGLHCLPGAPVPPGDWRVLVRFREGEDRIHAGDVRVAAGETVRIRCDAGFQRCRAAR